VTAYNYTPDEVGVFVVHAAATAERARSAAVAAWDQVRRARDGELTDAEVERACRMLEAQWLRRLETMEGQASHLASWELLGDWRRGGAYLDRLLSTSAQGLADVASRYLVPERAALVAYRPANVGPLAPGAAEMRAMLDAESQESLAALARPHRLTPLPGSRAWSLEREESGVSVFRTSAGFPVLVQRRAGPLAHIGWFVRGGALDEPPEFAGLTMLMTRTSLKGTERRSAQRIAEDAEFMGGVLSASAHADGFQWTLSVPVNRLNDAVELLGDVVQRPSFPVDALESERAVALANVASLRDDMYRWPMRLATEAAWAAHPYGQSVMGSAESLAAINADSLRRWHERQALEAPGALVIVANVNPNTVAGLASRYFGALRAVDRPAVEPPDWPAQLVEHPEERDKAQSALAMLFPGPSRKDPERFAAAMIAGITSGLGGRFFDELRDRQSLAYTVLAAPILRQRAGAFAAYIAMSPEKEEAARRGLLTEFAKLCDQPVTERELERAKTYALGSWAIRRESSASVLGDIADAWLYGESLAELSEYEDRVRGVTALQVRALARKYFDPARRVEGIVRGSGKQV
jgi:zinc protease